jgi:hypothetical protein
VQHVRFTLASLEVSGFGVPLQVGDLVVVRHDGATELDWELVATTFPVEPYEREPHQLEMVALDGRLLRGDAVVVRSDEQRHVFRGVGPLAGLQPTDGLDDGEDHSRGG